MSKFSLLETLNRPLPDADVDRKKLTSKVSYQEYDIDIHGNKKETVFIPKRNVNEFEAAIQVDEILTSNALRNIMRKFNGVKEI